MKPLIIICLLIEVFYSTLVSKINYSLRFRAINLLRLEAMWFLVTNKRYPKNVRQQARILGSNLFLTRE
jgi:hypothetical protein